mmetsp:Transcript_5025/g.11456  ORF Transcript_5025/g.11456 Transcript_5025/m.11456 type:complete len:209 (+) Transcript_5025:1071-1697(+)
MSRGVMQLQMPQRHKLIADIFVFRRPGTTRIVCAMTRCTDACCMAASVPLTWRLRRPCNQPLKCSPTSLNLERRSMKSSSSSFVERASLYSVSSSTRATKLFTSGISRVCSSAPSMPPLIARCVRMFSESSCSTGLCLSTAERVLFLRLKHKRTSPSHSTKLMGGGGLTGSMRTTDESTFGGGRNEFFDTFIKWSTLARSCVLTARRQ